jgi:hypothetical protein
MSLQAKLEARLEILKRADASVRVGTQRGYLTAKLDASPRPERYNSFIQYGV